MIKLLRLELRKLALSRRSSRGEILCVRWGGRKMTRNGLEGVRDGVEEEEGNTRGRIDGMLKTSRMLIAKSSGTA